MRFEDLGLSEPLLRAINDEGYSTPTPIQEQTIPHALAGKDVLGCAQTGTGKTAAFAMPILQRLSEGEVDKSHRPIRALIITPTRELAGQIGESFATYGRHTPLRHTVVYGGVRQRSQTTALKKGVDILVATPGRLLDLMQQRFIDLSHVEIFVLDEADRMLDMGFIDDIQKVIRKLPRKRQTLFFSATMPGSIQHLADRILRRPVEVRLAPESPTVDNVQQSVYFVERSDKQALLEHLLVDPDITRVLIFARTKRGADRVTDDLNRRGIPADVIHSDRPQVARQKAMDGFKAGNTRVLVASDIAARGIDIDDISHVINFDLPNEAEVYIHRIGRTARAGAQGRAVSFCDIEERNHLESIEKLIRMSIDQVTDHPYPSPLPSSRTRKAVAPPVVSKLSPMRRPRRRRLGRR